MKIFRSRKEEWVAPESSCGASAGKIHDRLKRRQNSEYAAASYQLTPATGVLLHHDGGPPADWRP